MIDTNVLAIPKRPSAPPALDMTCLALPKRPGPPVRLDMTRLAIPKTCRTVLSGARYTALKKRKWEEQRHRCRGCRRTIPDFREAHLHHKPRVSATAPGGFSRGRGMSGGKRDDEHSEVVCVPCHLEEPK